MDIFLTLVTVFLIIIACITCINTFTYPRLSRARSPISSTYISVLIPARNEGEKIHELISSWKAQSYPNLEIIILNDQSNDDTFVQAKNAVLNDDRFLILQGEVLPEGWSGKNWACHQLFQAAKGEILVFTDADVHWEPGELEALIDEMVQTKADMLTVWPTQNTYTWAERLIVPMLAFAFLGYLPVPALHLLPWPIFSAAIGQCLAFRKEAYLKVGGHAEFREKLVEDMALAMAIKRKQLRLRSADGAGFITSRMYKGWKEVLDGFSKNIIEGHGNNLILLLLSTFFHWSLFIFPVFWLFVDFWQGLILVSLGVLIRALTAAITGQRLLDAFGLPISVLLMTMIVFQALAWKYTGGMRWKGRYYMK